MKKITIYLTAIILFITAGCSEDYLDTENKEYVSDEQLNELANSSPEALLNVTDGILSGSYSYMREYDTWTGNFRHDDYGQKSIDLGLDLMSNDMVQVVDHWFGNYYAYRGRVETYSTTHIIWNFYYSIVKNMNDIIAFVPETTEDQGLRHVLGRALAMRGFCYFNLVRVYQYTYDGNQSAAGIPLYDGSSFEGQARATVSEVYTKIQSDLTTAYTLLADYDRSGLSDIDVNVVAGILARVYLETQDYSQAASMAREARTGYPLMSNSEWLDGFSNINNAEWMWGADIDSETSTIYASFFSHMGSLDPGYAGLLGVYKSIDKRLYDAISDTDIRKDAFAGPADADGLPQYANKKFKDLVTFFQGDYVYMRAAEMYLIEAEAEARGGDDDAAADVLYDLVSPRDASYTLSTNTGQDLLDEIYLHRRIELWGEGFAWYDMKRLKQDLVRDYSGSNHTTLGNFDLTYNDPWFLFQIPEDELNSNDMINDADQNP